MCGRYYIEIEDWEMKDILKKVEERLRSETTDTKTGEVSPTDIAPALTAQGFAAMRWGFPRYDGKGIIINARSESVMEKPMFSGPFASYRCLFPASFYFEWRNEGLKKTKYRMYQPDTHLIWLAGLAKDYRDGTPPKFVILTRPAAAGIGFVHDRMPLILPADTHKTWLHGNITGAEYTMNAAEEGINAVPA